MKRIICLCLGLLCALLLPLTTLSACGTDRDGAEDTHREGTESSASTENRNTDTEAYTMKETASEKETEAPAATEAATEEVGSTPEQTEVATEAATEPVTEAETATPVAGENSGLSRDGTPKKYFTLSFDDGITQDLRLMEIMKKYGVSCCTFNINTGLLGANWAWVGQQFGRPDVTHQRFTRTELSSGIYDGFDVEVHTSTHPSLKDLSDVQVKQQVLSDAKMITRLTGIAPVGMAWPGGDTEYHEQNIQVILENTDIRFARGTTATYTFALPQYFMTWYPTCSISDGNVLALAEQFIQAECTEDMLFYVWGHGYELDLFNTWDRFETLVRMMAEAASQDDSIVLVTNAQFYQLFKDEIPAWKG
ncbi:MAG: polysaccharide deacetylase family protein [Eubacteriales bacterium]